MKSYFRFQVSRKSNTMILKSDYWAGKSDELPRELTEKVNKALHHTHDVCINLVIIFYKFIHSNFLFFIPIL